MGIVVNMFDLPDSAVFTTAQKAIEAARARVKKDPVLTLDKLSVVHNVELPHRTGRPKLFAYTYCSGCHGVFPGNGRADACPHCGNTRPSTFAGAMPSTVFGIGHEIVSSVWSKEHATGGIPKESEAAARLDFALEAAA